MTARQRQSNPQQFFQSACEIFKKAINNTKSSRKIHIHIGGHTICLHFAGRAMIPFIKPAFEHVVCDSTKKSNLNIYIWDSISTFTEMVPPPWSDDSYIGRGDIKNYGNEQIHISYPLGPCTLSALNIQQNIGLFWAYDANRIPYYERAAPLRAILHWWMREHEYQLIHAAAVGSSNKGVLLIGKGCSGKSTTALNCLLAGMDYAGDDYVLIRRKPRPYVYSIYNSAKLDDHSIQRLPVFMPIVHNPDKSKQEKSLIFLNKKYKRGLVSGFPVNALIESQITGQKYSEIVQGSPMSITKALATSTIFQLSGAGSRDLHEITHLITELPCYILKLGTDLDHATKTIKKLVHQNENNIRQ